MALKKGIAIVLTTMWFSTTLLAIPSFNPDDKKPGDDKKGKAAAKQKEDTTAYHLSDGITDPEEGPDTTAITFPSHDLYASWDVNTAHPYKFNESFKEDSVVITLVNPGDNPFSLPYRGNLTSLFGWRKYRPHFGTDISLHTGDTIVSAFDGMVRIAKYYQGYGNCVIIRHNNGLETVYAHLSKILVESGQSVSSGQLLGLGGNTGHSYGSHLHFEIRYLGQAIDTQDFIDYETGQLKSNFFTLRKCDVENKYDLRAMHYRHRHDVGLNKQYANSKRKSIHVVRKGETLSAIARKNHTTVKALCKKNRLKPTSTLRIGQKIAI